VDYSTLLTGDEEPEDQQIRGASSICSIFLTMARRIR
jgi:hypothetical protein